MTATTAADFDPTAYGPAVAAVLEPSRLAELGPGQPNLAQRERLEQLSIATLLDGREVRDVAMGSACLAGLWLYHDFFDESHAISQDLATTTGSYWHGILHRREPDYGNAKYWFRRVGQHPVFDRLVVAAREIAPAAPSGGLDAPARYLVEQKCWDPLRFVDLCETAARGSQGELARLCRQIQLREWQTLFDYCYRSAVQPAARSPANL